MSCIRFQLKEFKLINSIRLPEPFKCTIKPRSKAAEELIRAAADSY